MKKLLLTALLVVLTATSSIATDTPASTAAISTASTGLLVKSGRETIGKLSSGDSLAWQTSTSGYAISTQHINGVKAFGTSHDGISLTWMPVTKGAPMGVLGTAGSASVSGTGWSIM